MISLKFKVKQLLKSETVLIVAFMAALISCFFIHPNIDYIGYIDFRVLGILFCLMGVVAGLKSVGAFSVLSYTFVTGIKNTRLLCLVLTLLCFFSAMFVTNDVALIAFVPFAILVLTITGQTKSIIFVVVMQTIAANLGSMLTPIGNPQNLYLYSYYKIPLDDFFAITAPVTILALILILVACMIRPSNNVTVKLHDKPFITDMKRLVIYLLIFILCILSVAHILDYRIMLIITLAIFLIFDQTLFKKIDYSLLATFICFFVFVGNIGEIETVKQWISSLLNQRELLVSTALSQIISNVPAAVLLSTFTDNAKQLILGTNIGGLGTLIASLASLISFKLYVKTPDAKPIRYLGIFTLYNIMFLAVIIIAFLLTRQLAV